MTASFLSIFLHFFPFADGGAVEHDGIRTGDGTSGKVAHTATRDIAARIGAVMLSPAQLIQIVVHLGIYGHQRHAHAVAIVEDTLPVLLLVIIHILFADEPSGNLDTKTKAEIHQLFFDLRERHGQTIVIVTHDPELAAMCDRSLFMRDGQFVEE